MNDAQLLRYNRQIMVPEIDIEGQEKILQGSAAVVGLGGLGSPVAMYLATAGVGHLTLIDDDNVDETNLQRQIIHSEASLSSSKTKSAARWIRSINSAVSLSCIDHRPNDAELRAICRKVDVAVDCTDNAESRYLLNTCCFETQTVLVSGAAIRMEGQLVVFDFRNSRSPCYRCLYPDMHSENLNCAENGVFAPIVGIIGTMQAMEALKSIAGLAGSDVGSVTYVDGKRMEFKKLQLRKNPNCPTCSVQSQS